MVSTFGCQTAKKVAGIHLVRGSVPPSPDPEKTEASGLRFLISRFS
jgi:hypothetical protein